MSLLSTDHRDSFASNTGVDALLSETIVGVLSEIFDRRTATLLAWRLRICQARTYPSDCVSSTAAFSHALHRILGSGADAIERLILRDVYSKSGTSFSPVPGYSFEDYIKALLSKIDDFSDGLYYPISHSLPSLSSTDLSSALPQTEECSEEEDRLRYGSSPVVFDGVEFNDLTVGSQAIPLEVLKAILEDR